MVNLQTRSTKGQIVTVNDAQPFAEAVAIKAGKILAVGTNEEIAKFQDKKTEVIDLGGHALLPGLSMVTGIALQRVSRLPRQICWLP